ncbi:major facilitator superfamily domain-containing protein [Calycina marina]|uniref:Major facilitator superfamily domain-containing protein n=1 Tax=Calycina marina TaxID=1763456 RepID=A0A9P7Z3Q2_9HELO|nr:major facilitator superfamily domain-containing protein [Calycina marina]
MQPVGLHLAEDSCLKDQHELNPRSLKPASPNVQGYSHGLKTENCPVSDKSETVTGTHCFSLHKRTRSESGDVVASKSPTLGHDPIEEKDDFPEGGLRAWLVVFGAFCGTFCIFGIINTTAVLLDYLTNNQLEGYSADQIGWIFGLGLFLTFFCGAPSGPIFDAYGPRWLMLAGSVLLVLSMFLLGECTKYWHFFMVYSVLNGIGGALVNTPCIASIGHFFNKRRGNATGVAMTSGSIGGIIFPLILQKLFTVVGFAWSMRLVGFLLLFLLIIANILVRSRLPTKPMTNLRNITPDLSLFKSLPFAFVTLSIFLMEWGIFVPLTYIAAYSNAQGHSTSFGYHIIAILNAGSFFGRFFAGIVADMIGRVNTLILSIILCIITCFALWMPAGDSKPMIIVFAIIFGFVSGSNLSLSPVCVGQMCATENYGRYFATCWIMVAFGTLTGLPIAGVILTVCDGEYWGVIMFTGLAYAGAALALTTARVLKVGWKWNIKY